MEHPGPCGRTEVHAEDRPTVGRRRFPVSRAAPAVGHRLALRAPSSSAPPSPSPGSALWRPRVSPISWGGKIAFTDDSLPPFHCRPKSAVPPPCVTAIDHVPRGDLVPVGRPLWGLSLQVPGIPGRPRTHGFQRRPVRLAAEGSRCRRIVEGRGRGRFPPQGGRSTSRPNRQNRPSCASAA